MDHPTISVEIGVNPQTKFTVSGSDEEDDSESVDSSHHSGTSDHTDTVHIVESPHRDTRPDMLPDSDTIDLTSPVVKQEIKQETNVKVCR